MQEQDTCSRHRNNSHRLSVVKNILHILYSVNSVQRLTYLTSAFDAFVSYTVVVHLKVFDDVCRSEYVSTVYLDPVVQATIIWLQS